jgi:hypothetical protein
MAVSPMAEVAYTVKDTAKNDGMSISFIGTPWKQKTPKSFAGLGAYINPECTGTVCGGDAGS